MQVAARELGVEAKLLHPETETALTRLAWPGNVRQLENTCRWLTVMAAGQEVLIQDLPGELFEASAPDSPSHLPPDSWATLLAQWADAPCDPVIKTCFLKRSQNWKERY